MALVPEDYYKHDGNSFFTGMFASAQLKDPFELAQSVIASSKWSLRFSHFSPAPTTNGLRCSPQTSSSDFLQKSFPFFPHPASLREAWKEQSAP
jgi:hypothetical protein